MFREFFWPWAGGSAVEQPALEVLHRAPRRRRFDTPLVFVHGAFVGAWCWDRFYLPYFAERGFDAHAVSLRGHGGSGGALQDSGILDYVADLRHAVAALARPPVLIAHSMGGLVVQRYLEEARVPAVVLMASVPPAGLMQSTLRLIFGDPVLFTQMTLMQHMGPAAVDVEIARRAIFSDRLPRAELEAHARLVQPESHRALWDMTATALPRPWRVTQPAMLVAGAADDALFSPTEVRQTADRYHAECHIEPEMAHAMMLEPGWQRLAGRIGDWLEGVVSE